MILFHGIVESYNNEKHVRYLRSYNVMDCILLTGYGNGFGHRYGYGWGNGDGFGSGIFGRDGHSHGARDMLKGYQCQK